MPRASRPKAKGGVQTSPKNVAATVKSLRRSTEAFQAAHKQLLNKRRQKKGTEEARVQLAIASSNLEEEKLDAEAILRQAGRSGLKTESLRGAINSASEALAAVFDEPGRENPPNPIPSSRIVDEPDPPTVVEGEEDEETTESNPVPASGDSLEDTRRANRAKRAAGTAASNFRNLRATRSRPPIPMEDLVEEEEDEDEIHPETRSRSGSIPKSPSLRSEVTESHPPKKSSKAVRPNLNSVENSRQKDENPAVTSHAGVKTKVRPKSPEPNTRRTKGTDPAEDLTQRDEANPSGAKSRHGTKLKVKLPERSKKSQSKKDGRSDCSGCSKRTQAEKDLNEAELAAKAIKNNIESLKAQLEAQKIALKSQNRNIEIHRDRVSNESENHSQASIESEESGSSRVKEWVDQAKKHSKTAKKESKDVIDELSTAAAAVLRHHLLQPQKSPGLSILESIKIMERRRPSEKFTGEDSSIDFEDHITQFKKAIDVPGLPASFKLAELREWFGGIAKTQVTRYVKRDDHEVALEEAIVKLRNEYGCQANTAEEMLEDIMSGQPLEARDSVGINKTVSKLEEAYFLAVETGRDADFNRKSLFRNILHARLPSLKSKWASRVAKAQTKGENLEKFEDFLRFLTMEKHHAAEMKKLNREPEKAEKSSKPTKKTAQKEKDDDGFSKVDRKTKKPKQGERRKREPSDCSLCENEKHWLHDCKKFLETSVEGRWEYCTERSVCPRCLRGGHKTEDCSFPFDCKSCGGGHNTLLHGAKDMPEELKRSKETDKKA